VVRHAHAQQVKVAVALVDQTLDLSIEDDGSGFDMEESFTQARRGNSLGLISMQERVYLAGGRMEIETSAGHGTKIHASFALDSYDQGDGGKEKRR
jgi:signal transduction histidine kinase